MCVVLFISVGFKSDLGIPQKLIRLGNLKMKNTMKIQSHEFHSETLVIKNGIRPGDALACLLFNIALEKIIRNSSINTSGTIFNKNLQVSGFADDKNATARPFHTLKSSFWALERKAREFNLTINQNKTNYMFYSRKGTFGLFSPPFAVMGPSTFESVFSFTYLASEINIANDLTAEINKGILAANRALYRFKKYPQV